MRRNVWNSAWIWEMWWCACWTSHMQATRCPGMWQTGVIVCIMKCDGRGCSSLESWLPVEWNCALVQHSCNIRLTLSERRGKWMSSAAIWSSEEKCHQIWPPVSAFDAISFLCDGENVPGMQREDAYVSALAKSKHVTLSTGDIQNSSIRKSSPGPRPLRTLQASMCRFRGRLERNRVRCRLWWFRNKSSLDETGTVDD